MKQTTVSGTTFLIPLKIAGMNHSVFEAKHLTLDGDDLAGRYDPVPHRIYLLGDLSPAMKAATLIHEAVHAISNNYNLEFSEALTTVLGQALWAMWADNPEFVKYINAALLHNEKCAKGK